MIRIQQTDAYRADIQRLSNALKSEEDAIRCMEECAELCVAISKAERTGNLDNLIEEMADVLIVIDIQRARHGVSDSQLEEVLRDKMYYNIKRLGKEL